jgi:uncharacterized membrane protein YfhO
LMKYLDRLDDLSLVPWLQMMNVGVIEKIEHSDPFGVRFDILEGGKRYWWFPCAIHVANEEDAWIALQQNMRLTRLDKVIWEDGKSSLDQDCSPVDLEYEILVDTSQKIVVQINTSQDVYFVLSDMWYPGWKAALDGAATSINPANYLFRGVMVRSGFHTLIFEYKPVSFSVGMMISGISLVLLLFFMVSVFISQGRLKS